MTIERKNRLLVNQADVLRVAITQGSQLLDLDVETPDIAQIKGNIYKGRISSIEPSLAAVFVDFGRERHGFLPFKEISPEYFNKDIDPTDVVAIAKVLKLGQPIIIQVEKEERGNKGAALTTYLSLAGSYLVLMPNNPSGGGISRRIEGEEREQLRKTLDQLTIPEKMSVIIRTAGVNKSPKELQWDLDTLLTYFDALKLAATMDRAAPYLIHQESNVLIRTLRDYMREDIDEVILDDKNCFDQAYNYMKQVRPELLDRVKHYDNPTPLFSRYQMEKQIESSFSREVRLPSGGSIIVDQTEALVAIDVNSARATRGKSIEETAFNTNVEAAREVARQLRLRDLGGLIIVDFIDMTQFKHQREVENALKEAVASDRARIQFARISRFGLLEMSRQRLRSGTNKNIRNACPRCEGTGMVRSVESLSRTIVHLLEEQASMQSSQAFQVLAPISVATHLTNERREDIANIEKNTDCQVTILPCQELLTPQYEIKSSKLDKDAQTLTPSYKHLKSEKTSTRKVSAPSKVQEQPRIEQFLKAQTEQKASASNSGGLFNFIKKIFTSEDDKKSSKPVAKTTRKNQSTATKKKTTTKQSDNKRSPAKGKTTNTRSKTNKNTNTRTQKPDSNDKSSATKKKTTRTRSKPDNKKVQNVSSDKKTNNTPSEITDLVMENDVSLKNPGNNKKAAMPKKRATKKAEVKTENKAAKSTAVKTPIQSDVVQRPMKVGQRISPKTENAANLEAKKATPKPAYKPGRKIVDAPASEKNENKPAAKSVKAYTPGKKIIEANGEKAAE